jgi:L-ascorbate metabolism protein UlaG (beta-lactamase superfamily)
MLIMRALIASGWRMRELKATYIGGPTTILEWGRTRFLTDPTFDPAGGSYPSGPATLTKLAGPALTPEEVGPIDAVLLSHDHHWDNLDKAGRGFLARARTVLTTSEGARRLGGNAIGLHPWEAYEIQSEDDKRVVATATPARHGPPGRDRGPVIGFSLAFEDAPDRVLYVSGDTVWFEGVEEVARRFNVRAAVLFLGAATVPEVGSYHLTMSADEAKRVAAAFPYARLVPLHFEGWAHIRETRDDIDRAFRKGNLETRLRWLDPGRAVSIEM